VSTHKLQHLSTFQMARILADRLAYKNSNIMENLISVTLTDAQWQDAETGVKALEKLFAGQLATLTPKQRQRITKMSDGSVPFTSKAMEYARTNPEFLPPYIKVEEFEIDLKAARLLDGIYQSLRQLVAQLDDSVLLSGAEAYTAARAYYASAKVAAKMNTPFAKVVVADLAERFAGQGEPADPGAAPQQ
jgi:hypothetical protein